MNTTQLTNLLTFTLMFHKICGVSESGVSPFDYSGTYFMNCDSKYIMEKYHYMIDIKPKILIDSLNPQHYSIRNLITTMKSFLQTGEMHRLKLLTFPVQEMEDKISPEFLFLKWVKKWNYTTNDSDFESILNYLCVVNSNPVIPTYEFIIDSFQSSIGNVDDICDIEYCHIHHKLKEFIQEYILRFRREINLKSLITN